MKSVGGGERWRGRKEEGKERRAKEGTKRGPVLRVVMSFLKEMAETKKTFLSDFRE